MEVVEAPKDIHAWVPATEIAVRSMATAAPRMRTVDEDVNPPSDSARPPAPRPRSQVPPRHLLENRLL
jgi:hypothetical protein